MSDATPRVRVVGLRVAQLAATVLVTWFVVDRTGLGVTELTDLDLSGWQLRPSLLALSCLVLAGGYFMTGWLWAHIVSGLGGPVLSTAVGIRLFMIANLGRYVPGKVWQIAGLAALARERGVAAATATAAAILGQGIALASATVIGMGAVWTLGEGEAWRWIVPAALVGGTVLGLLPPVFHGVSGVWFRVARTPVPPGLRPTLALGWLVVGLASWVAYAGAFWLLVVGLGFNEPLLATGSAFAAAYVLGYIVVFAPAGIGVREGFLIALMSPSLGAATAGAVAIVARLWTTIVEVVPAAAFWARYVTHGEGGAGE